MLQPVTSLSDKTFKAAASAVVVVVAVVFFKIGILRGPGMVKKAVLQTEKCCHNCYKYFYFLLRVRILKEYRLLQGLGYHKIRYKIVTYLSQIVTGFVTTL